MSTRWMIGITALVIVAAVAVAVVAVNRDRDETRLGAALATTSTAGIVSPYDLRELPADADLDVVGDASFISLTLPNKVGGQTSYGISLELPAAQALCKAIQNADKVDGSSQAGATSADQGTAMQQGAQAAADLGNVATMTFVLPSRETLTFGLDFDRGLISRCGMVWRVDGNLRALTEAATVAPQ